MRLFVYVCMCVGGGGIRGRGYKGEGGGCEKKKHPPVVSQSGQSFDSSSVGGNQLLLSVV